MRPFALRHVRSVLVAAFSPAPKLDPQVERPTVLVVEDEVLLRLTVAEELRANGIGVLEAANADEALALLQSQVAINLVLTDVRMPGSMDGLALANLLRQTRPGLKLIIASGHLPDLGPRETAEAFIHKPYDLPIVVKQIKALLASIENES